MVLSQAYSKKTMMNYQVIDKKAYSCSTWSGGKTTQLCLFPPQGSYQVGHFDFRISSATVELDETDFSSLPGYQRIIMTLDNPLQLIHLNQGERVKSVHLQPYEGYRFSGDDVIRSVGKCTDFNLIFKNGISGDMEVMKTGATWTAASKSITFIYALKNVRVKIQQGTQRSVDVEVVAENSLIVQDTDAETQLYISSIGEENPAAILINITV